MTPNVRRVDRVAVELLGQELVLLARGVEVHWLAAAERLGCVQLVNELNATINDDAPGTLRRLAQVVGRCLDAVDATKP